MIFKTIKIFFVVVFGIFSVFGFAEQEQEPKQEQTQEQTQEPVQEPAKDIKNVSAPKEDNAVNKASFYSSGKTGYASPDDSSKFYKYSHINNHKGSNTIVSLDEYFAGGFVGSSVGFGLGHAIQGRYTRKGWIFTISEVVSFFTFGVFMFYRNRSGEVITGAVYLGLKVWEWVDVWWLPDNYEIKLYANQNLGNFNTGTSLYSYNNWQQPMPGVSLGFHF